MFRKLRTTGKLKRVLTLLITVAILLSSVAFEAAASAVDRFDDVDPGAWYYESVALAYDIGFFKGTSDFHFQPKKTITRAEFVTALAKLCKADTASYNSVPFTDVATSHWGYHQIAWGYEMGIVRGVGNNLFAPGREISRQEMCVMLVGAIENVLKKTLAVSGSVAFSDFGSIASWAQVAVKKCASNGLVVGYNGVFRPLGIANRAEAATVLASYYKKNQSTPLLEVSGFYINFYANQDYYQCPDADFDDCRILKYNGSGTIKNLQVEHYQTGVKPYSSTAYKLGDKLNLGHGRAKVTFNIGTKTYTIYLTDSDDADWTKSLARITGSSVNLRSGPSTDYSKVTSMARDTWLYFYEKTHNSEGEDWYRVKIAATGQVGYVRSDFLSLPSYPEVAMPARYKTKIEALKKAHPNWTFSFVNVGVNYNMAALKYGADISYIDPLNYLDETNIFAFLDVRSYEFGNWTAEQIGKIWVQKSDSVVTKDQVIEYCMKTSKSALVNPLYVACRAALESGYGTSDFAKGMKILSSVVIDGETYYDYDLGAKYYNFYGIGARNSNPRYAMVYAKNQGWNSVGRSFMEGAAWIKQEYLDWGCSTPYFFRYAYKTNGLYMTDPEAPRSEAKILKKAYTDPNAKAHFIVPVYNNMPA